MKDQSSVNTPGRLGSPSAISKIGGAGILQPEKQETSSKKHSGLKMVNEAGKLHKNYSSNFKTGLTTFTGAIRLLDNTS